MTAKLLKIIWACLFFLATSTMAYAQDMPSQEELNALNETISEVQASIAQANTKRISVYSQVQESEKELFNLNLQINTLNQQIQSEQSQLATLEQQSQGLKESIASQQNLIGQYIRSAYQGGKEEYLKLLLNQEDIQQASRTIRFYQYFNQARASKIESFNASITELAEVTQKIQTSNLRLTNNREQLTQQQRNLQNKQTERQNLLDELDNILNQSGVQLANLEQERAEMTLLIEELNRAIVNLSLGSQDQAFADLKGKLPWPVTGRLLNSFGQSYDLGDLDWQGVTIAGEAGENVQAIHHGRVIFSDWFANSGLLLIIDHGDGYMSLYAHNQLLYKSVGDWVNSGETIAAIGNTGGRKEYGVYFEIRHNSDSVDPTVWCADRS